LWIDRRIWLPSRLSVPYERGPYTVRYSDYRPALGLRMPFTIETRYGTSSVRHVESVAAMSAGQPHFAAPPPVPPARFDASVPARLTLRRGTPFGPSTPGHLFAEAAVDGAPAGWFLLDSGADGMMIDAALADRLGLPIVGRTRSIGADGRPREATFRRGRSFRVGRLTFDNPLFLALDLSGSNAPAGEKRAGVIGYDVFAHSVVEFARGGEAVTLCDPAAYRLPAPARWQPLGFIDLAPAVEARLEGDRTGLFQIDTGAAGSVDFYKQYLDATGLLAGRETREVQSSGAGGVFAMRAGRIAWLDLGGRRFANVEAGFRTNLSREGGAGVIGRELMAPFLVVFDYPHRRIAFVLAGRARTASGCR
jgi:predicted aspartyl protease